MDLADLRQKQGWGKRERQAVKDAVVAGGSGWPLRLAWWEGRWVVPSHQAQLATRWKIGIGTELAGKCKALGHAAVAQRQCSTRWAPTALAPS